VTYRLRSFLALTLMVVTAITTQAAGGELLKAHRFEQNPIIRPEMLPDQDGSNINGPSLIRVPN